MRSYADRRVWKPTGLHHKGAEDYMSDENENNLYSSKV